jgi:hypothetical protein
MRPSLTNRGFKHMPPFEVGYGGRLAVYESSTADAPHVWINAVMKKHPGDPRSEKISVSMHLQLDDVDMLIDQLLWLRDNHYQRPEGDRYPAAEGEPPWWHQ